MYLPDEFILVAGYVSHAMYFVAAGKVQIIRKRDPGSAVAATKRAADKVAGLPHNVWLEDRTDFFNELALFLEKRGNVQSARALTHTDTYRLEKSRFEGVLQDYPTSGMRVADAAQQHLSAKYAADVRKKIYEMAGVPELLQRWRPRRGLAAAVIRLAKDMKRNPEKYEASKKAAQKDQKRSDFEARAIGFSDDPTAALFASPSFGRRRSLVYDGGTSALGRSSFRRGSVLRRGSTCAGIDSSRVSQRRASEDRDGCVGSGGGSPTCGCHTSVDGDASALNLPPPAVTTAAASAGRDFGRRSSFEGDGPSPESSPAPGRACPGSYRKSSISAAAAAVDSGGAAPKSSMGGGARRPSVGTNALAELPYRMASQIEMLLLQQRQVLRLAPQPRTREATRRPPPPPYSRHHPRPRPPVPSWWRHSGRWRRYSAQRKRRSPRSLRPSAARRR